MRPLPRFEDEVKEFIIIDRLEYDNMPLLMLSKLARDGYTADIDTHEPDGLVVFTR